MVTRRHVYHLAGYDPVDASAQYRRFARQLGIFQRTWNVRAKLSDIERSDEQSRVWWTVRARASNWQVETVHEIMIWDDIVRDDLGRPLPVRLCKAALAYLSFIATGTMFRYVMANHRYAVFALFPLCSLALFAAVAWVFASLLIDVLGIAGISAGMVGLLTAVVVFVGLLQWPGRRWRVLQLLDDWGFARAYLCRRRPDLDARLDRFAELLIARSRDAAVDEIVIVGHSLGAMLAIDVMVRALACDPDIGRRGMSICVLTVGATIPKFALHPSADSIRNSIARVAAEPSIAWAEFHTRDDIISFYKFDPVSLRRIAGDRLDGNPVIRRVQIRDMLQPKTLRRYRGNVLRLHYQSVMANNRRALYDYFLMVCGPVPFSRWTTSPAGFLDFIEADGAYLGTTCRGRKREVLSESVVREIRTPRSYDASHRRTLPQSSVCDADAIRDRPIDS